MVLPNRSGQPGWQPPRWLFSVIAILIVAWWLSRQPPPPGERGTAPAPEQNARFEPSIPVDDAPTSNATENSAPADVAASNPQVPTISATDEPAAAATESSAAEKPTRTNETRGPPTTTEKTVEPKSRKPVHDPLIIPNVSIKDQSGRVAYQGKIDLHPTFDRIERGEKFPHRNDGSTFRNLEGRLPKKPNGYYTEYVHPTKGLNGPGPQRIVIGKNGEAFYTHDHYNSFRKVRE